MLYYFYFINPKLEIIYSKMFVSLQHPQIQKKTSKFIRYLCAENRAALDQWIMGIRIAKVTKNNANILYVRPLSLSLFGSVEGILD